MSRVVALAAGGLATAALIPAGLEPFAIAGIGLAILWLGRVTGRESRVSLGGLLLFAGVVFAALLGLPDALVLFATLAAVVAWDAGENAVTLRAQLGPGATTTRAEFAHAGATAVAGGVIGGLTLLTAILARGRLPALAGIVLVAGAILLGLGLAPFGDAAPE